MQFFAFQTTVLKPMQPVNAFLPISVTEFPIATKVKPVQSENASAPISVTESLTVTEASPTQPMNACLPMPNTEFGIVNAPFNPLHS